MLVVGVCGSPRPGGNTDILLDKTLDGSRAAGASVQKISLGALTYSPCLECGGCGRTGTCVLDDDMRIVYDALNSADAVIVASPIFFGNLTAQLKAVVDRFQCAWIAKYILGRPKNSGRIVRGAFLCVSASRKRGQCEAAEKIVKNLFATLGVEYVKAFFCQGVDAKGIVGKRPKALERAYRLGFEIGHDKEGSGGARGRCGKKKTKKRK